MPVKINESDSLKMCRQYLGQKVLIKIDRPIGTFHKGTKYELNYGYIPETKAPDGEELDAYLLGIQTPLKEASGICIACVHRFDDDDDKLIISLDGTNYSDEEIEQAVYFQEQFFAHCILRE